MSRLVVASIGILVLVFAGCKSPSTSSRATDTTLTRYSKAGHQAFAEGQVVDAIAQYRQAISRAWAIDDPYESGTNAYNLAVCLTSEAEMEQAKAWLLDARIELCRAGSSAGNVWLLEAKIAKDELRFEDAAEAVNRAQCSAAPCDQPDQDCLCGPSAPCLKHCLSGIPCVAEKVAIKQSKQDCENEFQAQIHLARAGLAAEQYDIVTARAEFDCACARAKDRCDHNLQAELQHVAALIHLAGEDFLSAAWHFDREAKHLRLAGNYREIPDALNRAAAAFEQAGRADLATARMCRVARIWLGRGDARQAWHHLQIASQIARSIACQSANAQLRLVAQEIERALEQDADACSLLGECRPGMLAADDRAVAAAGLSCSMVPREAKPCSGYTADSWSVDCR